MIQWKPIAVAAALLAAAGAVTAKDLRAVTEDGRKVVLSENGQWRFDSSAPAVSSPVTNSPYRPSAKRFSVAFNPSEWVLQPQREDEGSVKRSFQHKSLPLHAMVISDEMPATTPNIKTVMLTNAKSAGAETTVLFDELVKVSDKDVGSLRMVASIKGMDFIFWSYYFANEDGNIQVTCFTAQALFYKYEGECRKFLASFRID